MAIIYCKGKNNRRIKVWLLTYDVDAGETVLYKYKPHLMGIKADLPFRAYATQQKCFVNKDKEIDMKRQFEKHPEVKIIIVDMDELKKYISYGRDWAMYGHLADYGDGKQIFLDIKYMKEINLDVEKNEWKGAQI